MRQQQGFSLVSVLVASGIIGIIALGLAQLIAHSVQSQKLIQQRQASVETQLNLVGILSDRAICEANFKNKTVAADALTRLVSNSTGTPNVILQEGVSYDRESLRVNRIELMHFRPYANAGSDLYRGTMDLVIGFSGIGSGLNSTTMSRTVLLAVELNAFPPVAAGDPNGIKTCVAVGNDFNNVWRLKPNGDIYYQAFNVGIGTSAPAQRLEVVGNVLAEAYLHSSDARLKEEISQLNGLQIIEGLRGVSFQWKDSGRSDVGLIAQDVEEVLPEAVVADPVTGYRMVSYDKIVAPLVEANKELAARTRQLEQRVRILERSDCHSKTDIEN